MGGAGQGILTKRGPPSAHDALKSWFSFKPGLNSFEAGGVDAFASALSFRFRSAFCSHWEDAVNSQRFGGGTAYIELIRGVP